MEVLFLRDDDIPESVASGVADVGIVGLNEVMEKRCPVGILKKVRLREVSPFISYTPRHRLSR